jgi:alpha-acetolactate decarboxylase
MIIWGEMVGDPGLGTLLLLDGESFVVEGGYWVKFDVKQVPVSREAAWPGVFVDASR